MNWIEESEGERRTGRSTRIIDDIIQQLFTTGTAIVKDHKGDMVDNLAIYKKALMRL